MSFGVLYMTTRRAIRASLFHRSVAGTASRDHSPDPKNNRKKFARPDRARHLPVMSDIAWQASERPVAYPDAVAAMEARVAAIRAGTAPELVWLLEHPALYTAGTGTGPGDLLLPDFLPVFRTGRGGKLTYHGPGQRVAYVMLDLGRRARC